MSAPPTGVLTRLSFLAGSAGLLLAMLVEASAVVGRHLGMPLHGSIELVQGCIVALAASALVWTTMQRAHATVHVLTERLAPTARAVLQRGSELLGALFFAALSAGSIWIAAELWGGHEATDALGLPIAPLRMLWCASTALCVLVWLRAAFRRRPGGSP
jgi:TRAP-type C4-dicarboxylate transport system permease small subunit